MTIQPSSDRDHIFKWGGLVAFVAIIAAAGYVIYQAGQPAVTPNQTASNTVVSTPAATAVSSTAADQAAQGTPAPTKVVTATDLNAADAALDSSDTNSVTNELGQNDSDLASF